MHACCFIVYKLLQECCQRVLCYSLKAISRLQYLAYTHVVGMSLAPLYTKTTASTYATSTIIALHDNYKQQFEDYILYIYIITKLIQLKRNKS